MSLRTGFTSNSKTLSEDSCNFGAENISGKSAVKTFWRVSLVWLLWLENMFPCYCSTKLILLTPEIQRIWTPLHLAIFNRKRLSEKLTQHAVKKAFNSHLAPKFNQHFTLYIRGV
jgi:hypothetical protein